MTALTIAQALSNAKQMLSTSGSDSIDLDAELLLANAIGRNRTYLYTWPEALLTETQSQQFFDDVTQRQAGTPVAHILQTREFWGLPFKVTEATLIPRPDTEILVETALEKLTAGNPETDQAWSVLDLGTGSGAIACALASSGTNCRVTAVDVSPQALAVAKDNAQRLDLDLRFCSGSWFEPLAGERFELIVSNPPYIREDDPHLSQGDVRFEPLTALTSGETGLDDITQILQQAGQHLKPNGWLMFEHGYDQADAVQTLFRQYGFESIETRRDYGGQPRVTFGQWPKTAANETC
jgi:release factor glutamine methyltransferase